MGGDLDFDSAEGGIAALAAVSSCLDSLISHPLSKMGGDDLLDYARSAEQLYRKAFALQIRVADEIDQQGLASARSCPSSKALLKQALNISAADANLRIKAARALLPQDLPSGGETPPRLPVLAAAVDDGLVTPEHIRTTVATMRNLPVALSADLVEFAEQTLVACAFDFDPDQHRKVAAQLEEAFDPDGTLDGRDPAERAELYIGTRSTATGLTPFSGKLDDLGIETLRTAIDGLAAPRPEADGIKDQRPAATRRAHALVEVLTRALTDGELPSQGGEKPQIVVTLNWDLIQDRIRTATLDSGATLTPAAARRMLCDATIIPAVLGGNGEVLDLGRSARTFNRATRRAITLRDKGCAWPGCDRKPSWCDCHHVDWWARDLGHTSHTNGCLLCAFHHSEIHKGQWTIVFNTDGVPEFIPPKWMDPTQRPRRNTMHHLVPK